MEKIVGKIPDENRCVFSPGKCLALMFVCRRMQRGGVGVDARPVLTSAL